MQKVASRFCGNGGSSGRALILRSPRTVAMTGDNSEEGQAVDEALYALRALRNCLELKTSEPKAA